MFFSRSFMMLCLTFSFWAILSLILCMVWGSVLTSLIYMQLSSFRNTTCWRDCLSSLYILASCVKDYLTVGIWVCFQSLPSLPLSHICFCTMLFGYRSFVALPEAWEGVLPGLVIFLSISLAILGLLWLHINVKIMCSSSVKNFMGNLIRITLNL